VGERCPWCLGDEPPAQSILPVAQSPSDSHSATDPCADSPITQDLRRAQKRRGIFVMNIEPKHLDALQSLGYTESEARFLYIVATRSGYFVARQFLAFDGAHWGKRTAVFWGKLQAQKHAHIERHPKTGATYHVFSRGLYRLIEKENLRNRRIHGLDFIKRRIAILDFALANQP
jgi:hypothetical protein